MAGPAVVAPPALIYVYICLNAQNFLKKIENPKANFWHVEIFGAGSGKFDSWKNFPTSRSYDIVIKFFKV